jgi:hypothetical protein
MSENVVFLIAVASEHKYLKEKHGGFKYFEYSIASWKYWCEKWGVRLYIYDTPGDPEHVMHKPTWQRWFDVFDQLEENDIDYNKIAVIDASTIIRWDTPNFFDRIPNGKVNVFRSLENIRWVYQGVSGYADFFKQHYPDFTFDLTKYMSCGWQIFDKSHKPFLNKLKTFYYDNYDKIMVLQNDKVCRGTDQPVYNYLLQIHNVNIVQALPPSYFLNHLHRFDWFSNNWQLLEMNPENNWYKIPFFIHYGYIWFYSGFAQRGDRYNLMKQTWKFVKSSYK